MVIAGYDSMQELSRTEWSILYRARRRADRTPVLCKTPLHDPPFAHEVAFLAHEYELLCSISGERLPRVREFLVSADSHCLVLDDTGGESLQFFLRSQRSSLAQFFQLARHLCSVVQVLHQHEIIHQGLTPSTILVHPQSGEVTVVDFSFASRTRGGSPLPVPTSLLRETLKYLSPEQTGRMNRTPDYRSDFYALGLLFYELLTGTPPFSSDDALELIHWHIAKTPLPPIELNSEVPLAVSHIVMKLLAKTAEERYQSAQGLGHDLDHCAREWTTGGQIAPFVLGQHDVTDRFLIPQRLYGREREVAQLLGAFERLGNGHAVLLLVAGYSGIGKTSLVQELYKPIVRERGYFAAGKFDHVARSVPYSGFLQALRGLIQQILTESDEQLARWCTRLTEALGNNGGVVSEVVPELELLLGKQPMPPPLGMVEAQNRFQRVFHDFLRTLARREHPLVIFLDDLQWADAATLGLLPALLTSADLQYLCLIGAYRDNEVSDSHPLTYAVRHLEEVGMEIRRLPLAPLGLAELALLIGDTVHDSPTAVEPLARLVLEKTDGNPFFVVQFLRLLWQDGLLQFDSQQRRWTYQLDAITNAALMDNVVDLMVRKIQQLSPEAQQMLMLAACIGHQFDVRTLAPIGQTSPEVAVLRLREAQEEGLLRTVGHPSEQHVMSGDPTFVGEPLVYAFLHDRVQQTAYALIPDGQRRATHLTIGRLLLAQEDGEQREEQLFDLVYHLNLGCDLLTDDTERTRLAQLNLRAGRKAKASAAYDATLRHLTVALSLCPATLWEHDYEFAFTLHLEAAECAYLSGRFDEAERAFAELLPKAHTRLDKAKIYYLKILQYEHTSRYLDAIQAARDGIALFGLSFPHTVEEKRAALDEELAAIQRLMADRTIESLVDLPVMTDPNIRTVVQLMSNVHTSCFLSGDKPLTLLNIATMIRLSLTHGHLAESAYAYVLRAAMLDGPIREDYQTGYAFGLLALRLNERLYDPALRSKILMMFAWSVSHWWRPLEESFAPTREAFRLANETGLFVDAAWALFNEIWFAMLTASDLAEFQKTFRANVEYSERTRMQHLADGKRLLLQWGRALQGLTEHPCSFSDETFDEAAYCHTYRDMRLFLMFHIAMKLSLLYTFGEYHAARDAARRAEEIIQTDFTGTIWDEIRTFYHALTLTALSQAGTPDEQEERIKECGRLCARLRKWADSSPYNFQAQYLLVSAELARVQEHEHEALSLYETALETARRYHRQREYALANELYAQFRQERGQEQLSAVFMREARDAYEQWGAMAKVRALQQRYGDLLTTSMRTTLHAPSPQAGETSPLAAAQEVSDDVLDVATVVKAAQALTAELDLLKLLERLLRLAIENAGAERGGLVLEREGEAHVCAVGTADAVEVTVQEGISLESAHNLPVGIVQYVRRTRDSLVLADASQDDRYATDAYVMRQHPRSVLCTPVLNQGRLVGVLYLENNLATAVFTDERLNVVRVLAAEAAISLENARLYEEMKQEVAHRRQAEEELRVALSEVEALKNQIEAENLYLQEEIRAEHNFEEMVGNSPVLLDTLRQVELVAPTDAVVLILGETGIGKELIARAIHSRSGRKNRPLVKVNCGAISAGLVESELFGHVKGAFTGALENRAGRFELAHGGTLFLDEVGELPLDTQVKLLRVLQEQEFEPVGGNRTVRVDVRIIAATNRDLQEAVKAGRFRSDLFYRLHVFPLHVPSLRERRSDIPQLVLFFLARFAKQFGKSVTGVSQETMELLVNYSWPGNVRELQNLIERAVILSRGSTLTIDPHLLPATAAEVIPATTVMADRTGDHSSNAGVTPPANGTAADAASLSLEELGRRHILAMLRQAGGIIEGPKGAAKLLNLHPNTLRSRMKKLGIKRSDV